MDTDISNIHRLLSPFLVTGLAGTELTHTEREMLSQAPPAGVILFHRNVESAGQLDRLTGEVKSLIEEATGLTPLVMADHEGGRISVLSRAIGAPPSQMAAWRPGSGELLAGIVAATSRLMSVCGINLSLSPVADVNSEPLNPVIGTRSFGEDPEEVSAAVRIAVRALAGEGMLSCLKHFPGHGAAALDSHLTLPVIGRTIEELRKEELTPFIVGIEEGADTVMTAHIALSEGDPPASLDSEIVTDLLRGKLGFKGVVITDALEMAGVLPDGLAMKSVDPASGRRKSGSAVPASIAARALGVGNDLLLMSRPLEEVYSELALHSAVLGDELSTAALAGRMEESVERIVSLRERANEASQEDPSTGELQASLDRGRDAYLNAALLTGSLCFSAGETVAPVFLGAESDFDSYVVRRFIFRVLEGLAGVGPYEEHPHDDHPHDDHRNDHPDRVSDRVPERFFDPDKLGPVGTDGGLETGLYLFEPVMRPVSKKVLFLLCRKPPPEDVIRTVAAGYDSVVAAGRPWDAALLPPGTSVVVTYGIYDAAADRIAGMIRGGI
jgi:beta-glucosidase-like glycosyl hydrolase